MKSNEDILKEIENKFNEDVPLPESLSKSNVVKMLEDKNIRPQKAKVKVLPKIMSAAAILAVVLCTVIAFGMRSDFEVVKTQDETEQASQENFRPESSQETEKETETDITEELEAAGIMVAKSESDLRNHFVKMYTKDGIYNFFDDSIEYVFDIVGGVSTDTAVNDNMQPTVAATAAPMAPQYSTSELKGSAPHGQTNLQEEKVDEGDIIKNDGRYLYIISYDPVNQTEITVVDTKTMSEIYSGLILDEYSRAFSIRDIYFNNNILTAICTLDKDETFVVTYDTTEKHNPKEIRRVDQDGYYVSSRMVGSVLYTVTNYSVRGSTVEEVKNNAIPSVCDCYIPCEKCYIVDEESTRYIVLSAFDTAKPDAEVSSLSILGSGFNTYSSENTLYVYETDYDRGETDGSEGESYIYSEITNIHAFSLDGTNIKFKASGTIPGTCVNQYSFDEYKGNLRVATCYYNYKNDKDVSSVYILDGKLEIIGKVTDIADDEQVKSVRFMGETGYVVTFRNTDPLFIIDFSDPKKPVITGEVKIPGFSSYLHPIGENYLVGVGYDGDEQNANLSSVKVSLFDVSDKTAPKEVDTFVIKDATAVTNSDTKAFFYYPEKSLIGIPVQHQRTHNGTDYGYYGEIYSFKVLKIENGKFTSNIGFMHNGEENSNIRFYNRFFRGTYVGNMLYTIDNYNVIEHNIDNGEKTRECVIGSPESNSQSVVTGTTSAPYIIYD